MLYCSLVACFFKKFLSKASRYTEKKGKMNSSPNSPTTTAAAHMRSCEIEQESTEQILSMFPGHLHLLPQTPQLHFLFTIIRNRDTQRTDFVFYSERIMRLILEAALCLIPVTTCNVVTPTNAVYKGVQPDDKGIIGVSILRAGESMERVFREMCRGVRIGKILVQRNELPLFHLPLCGGTSRGIHSS